MRKQQAAFESFRNNTNIFEVMRVWKEKTRDQYDYMRLESIMTKYQFELCKYMAGEEFVSGGNYQQAMMPRGVLAFWTPGSGKTLGFVAAGLYVLARRPKEYNQGVVVIITNKSLYNQTQAQIVNYLERLNAAGLGTDLLPRNKPFNVSKVTELIRFITYNDSKNLDRNVTEYFSGLKGFENRFVIVDEAHNLFRTKQKEGERGNVFYKLLMTYDTIYVIFATGTPISSDPAELVPCFYMLTKNADILDARYFNEVFVSERQQHINREILVRRIYGLTHLVEQSSYENKPLLLPIYLHQLPMNEAIVAKYEIQRRKEGVRDKFMQISRILSNAVVSDKIISDKFAVILGIVANTPQQLHIVFSNFVQGTCNLFRDYCMRQDSAHEWQEVVLNERYQFAAAYANGKLESLTPRINNYMRLMMVHGEVDPEKRSQMINLFNSKANFNGALVNVLVLSPASVEGLNVKRVQHVHIVEPQWSWAYTEYIIYRAVRMGSHTDLAPQDRQVQPHIYIAYNHQAIDPEPTNKTTELMSTDQIVYFMSKKKHALNKQFVYSLAMSAFNCDEYKGQMAVHIQNQFMFDVQTDQICYSCLPTNKQLFSPENIYKDFAQNNCIREHQQYAIQPTQYITAKNIYYGYIYDPYARFGVHFYETRDSSKNFISEESDLFQLLLGILKSLVIPVDYVKKEETDYKSYPSVNVRIYKTTSNQIPHFLLSFLGPASSILRASYFFSTYSSVYKTLQSALQDIKLTPSAAVLLLHFTNDFVRTQQQIINLLSAYSDKLISVDALMSHVRNNKKHSLNNFPDAANDLSFLNRQSFLFQMQQFTFKRTVEEVVQILVNQIQTSSQFADVINAMLALVNYSSPAKAESSQLVVNVPESFSLLDMYIIKHALMILAADDVFLHVKEQTPSEQVLKHGFSSQMQEKMSDRPPLRDRNTKPNTSPLLIASLINYLVKPLSLLWKPIAYDQDRLIIQRTLPRTKLVFSSQTDEPCEYELSDDFTLRSRDGRLTSLHSLLQTNRLT